jgi:ABC-2 type transport system permease protein
LFRVEIGRSIRRVRTYVFGAGLLGLAVLPVVLLATGDSGSGGPLFFDLIRRNGLFAALTVLALLQPFFLPLGTSLLSGEAVAGEAATGTLRYLVARPVGRARLVLVKYAAVMTQVAAAIVWVMAVGLVAGGIAFGLGPLPTLSGTMLSEGTALLRIGAAGLYVLCGMAGLAAIGMFISTLTDSGLGAAGATMALAITSQIMDGLPALRAIQPYLISHDWFAFVDLFRSPVEWGAIAHGLVLAGAYTLLFLGAALAVFARKDVVS